MRQTTTQARPLRNRKSPPATTRTPPPPLSCTKDAALPEERAAQSSAGPRVRFSAGRPRVCALAVQAVSHRIHADLLGQVRLEGPQNNAEAFATGAVPRLHHRRPPGLPRCPLWLAEPPASDRVPPLPQLLGPRGIERPSLADLPQPLQRALSVLGAPQAPQQGAVGHERVALDPPAPPAGKGLQLGPGPGPATGPLEGPHVLG